MNRKMTWTVHIFIFLTLIYHAAAQCDSSPCTGGVGGTCIDNGVIYLCICNDGTTGLSCDGEVGITTEPPSDSCNPSPCDNGGFCTVVGNGYICTCPAGWGGTNCDTNVACDSNPCLNSGVCSTNSGGGFTCVCASSFYGIQCENQCASGVAVVNCLTNYDPCSLASCTGTNGTPVSGATCVSNQCGGCNAVFVDSSNNGVTCSNSVCLPSDACLTGQLCYEEWLPGPRVNKRCA